MPLSNLFLALTLILWGFIGLGFVDLGMNVVYVMALITGILVLLQGFSVFTWSTPTVRRVE